MTFDELVTAIKRRCLAAGLRETANLATTIATLIRGYEIKVGLESFTEGNFVLWDLQRRSVGLYRTDTRSGVLWCEGQPFTDILVLTAGEMVLGWVDRTQIVVSEADFTTQPQQLRPMPKVFDFSKPCPHLTVYGGWWEQDLSSWLCYGCDELIPRVDL